MKKLSLFLVLCLLLQCLGLTAFASETVTLKAGTKLYVAENLEEELLTLEADTEVDASVDGSIAKITFKLGDETKVGFMNAANLPKAEPVNPDPQEEPAAENEPENLGDPAGEEPAGEEPAGEEPAGEEPAGEEPAGEEPAGEEPAGEEPAGEEPAGEEPAGEEPAGEEPAGEEPAGEEPAGEEPAGEEPAGEEPAGEEPAGEEPAGEEPAGEEPAGEEPAGEEPAGEEPAGEEPAGEEPAGEEPAGEEPAAEEPAAEEPAAEEPAAKEPAPVVEDSNDAEILGVQEARDPNWYARDGVLMAYLGPVTHVTLPLKVGNMNITALDEAVFSRKANVISVTIPNGITLAVGAFSENTALTNVTIGDGVTTLPEKLFEGCTALTGVSLPNSLNTIGHHAFSGCTALQSIILPNSVSTVGEDAFSNCTKLANVTMPSGLTTIPAKMFENDAALTGITIPNTVTRIGERAFANTGLTGIAMPNSVTRIDENCFSGCTKMTYADLSTNLTWIGAEAFRGDTALLQIYIPDLVTYVGNAAFENCSAATTLHISAALTVINNFTFSGCKALKEVVIPNGVTSIGREAFYNCSGLEVTEIAASVGIIGENAFAGTGTNNMIVMWNGGATLMEGALGTNGILLSQVMTNAHNYAINHPSIRFGSIEIVRFVMRCYTMLLNRAAERQGWLFWSRRLVLRQESGATLMAAFVHSEEFRNRNVGRSAFVDLMYNTMLNRAPDPDGKALWLSFLNNGASGDVLIAGFAVSEEFRNLCLAYGINAGTLDLTNWRDKNMGVTAFVARCYRQALQREGETAGIEHWCRLILTKTLTPYQVATGFVFSQEATNKKLSDAEFVKMLYRLYLGREAEPAGLAYWTGFLSQGRSRWWVEAHISTSQEFREILASYGL